MKNKEKIKLLTTSYLNRNHLNSRIPWSDEVWFYFENPFSNNNDFFKGLKFIFLIQQTQIKSTKCADHVAQSPRAMIQPHATIVAALNPNINCVAATNAMPLQQHFASAHQISAWLNFLRAHLAVIRGRGDVALKVGCISRFTRCLFF
jgi:hypothetical protein